jgi:hypothetical protein
MLRANAQARVTFQDEFNSGSLDLTKWIVATYKSPIPHLA